MNYIGSLLFLLKCHLHNIFLSLFFFLGLILYLNLLVVLQELFFIIFTYSFLFKSSSSNNSIYPLIAVSGVLKSCEISVTGLFNSWFPFSYCNFCFLSFFNSIFKLFAKAFISLSLLDTVIKLFVSRRVYSEDRQMCPVLNCTPY